MVIITSFAVPESPIRLQVEDVKVVVDKREFGVGTLYISESTLCWKGQDNMGFSVPYTHISMHAICKDPLVCPSECVYVMIDTHFIMPGSSPLIEDAMESTSSDSEPDVSEMLLIPNASGELVTSVYEALMQCQALNPDPSDMSEEDEDEDEDNVYQDAVDEGVEDIGGGGDTEMENIAYRLSHNAIQINYEYNNGNQQLDEDQYEDAD